MAVSVRGRTTPVCWLAAELGSPNDALALRCESRHVSVLVSITDVDQQQSAFPLIRFESSLVPHPQANDWIAVSLPTGWSESPKSPVEPSLDSAGRPAQVDA